MLYIVSAKLLYKFSSTQINAPSEIASKVKSWCNKNIDDKNVYTDPDDPTLGREDNPHITVKYGIHTSVAKKIRDLITGFGSFDVTLGKISKFESEDYDVLKINVKSKRLHDLNKLINSNLEITDKFPEYIPHLTLSYVKKGSCKDLINNSYFEGLSWNVEAIEFCTRMGKQTTISIVD